MTNKLDQIYRSIRLTKYFVKGWGEPENLKRLCEFRKVVSDRKACFNLVPSDYPVVIDNETEDKACLMINGHFTTPLIHYLPEVVPDCCHVAYFQYVLPKGWLDSTFKPVIIHLAGTGDQYFWRRRNLVAKPLIKEAGIGSIILENPFYGLRKPDNQTRTILQNVSDVLVMGGCLTLESLVLFHYSERMGFGPLGITGLSMGGHMATIAATAWPKPLVIVPCLAGITASYVFTQGVVSHALNWKMLQEEYLSKSILKDEVQKMVHIIEGDAFRAGQQFAKQITENTVSVTNTSHQITSYDPNCIYGKILPSSRQLLFFEDKYFKFKNNNCDSNNFNANFFNISKKNVNASNFKESNIEKIRNESFANTLLNSIVKTVRDSIHLSNLSNETKESELKKKGTSAGEQEAVNFMHGIMDECTHLKQFAVPVDTSLAIAVCADNDAYIPLKARSNFSAVWPGAEVRYVKGGHVRAYLQCQKDFRTAIIDSFNRYRLKYIN